MTMVTLTFDDGPWTLTPLLLDVLRDTPSIFFINGQNFSEETRQMMVRATREWHVVANHSFGHYHLPQICSEAVETNIRSNEALIRAVTGRTLGFVRPPFGDTSPAVKSIIERAGCAQFMWDVDSEDWKYPTLEPGDPAIDTIVNNVVNGVANRPTQNSVVLLHDGASGRSLAASVTVVKRVIQKLTDQGFTFGVAMPFAEWKGAYPAQIGWGGGGSGGVGWTSHATLTVHETGALSIGNDMIYNASYDWKERVVSWVPGPTPGGNNTTGGKVTFHRDTSTVPPPLLDYYWKTARPRTRSSSDRCMSDNGRICAARAPSVVHGFLTRHQVS